MNQNIRSTLLRFGLSIIVLLAIYSPSSAGGFLRLYGGGASGDAYGAGGGAVLGFDVSGPADRVLYMGADFQFQNGTQNVALPVDVVGPGIIGDLALVSFSVDLGVTAIARPLLVRVGGTVGSARLVLDSGGTTVTSARKLSFGPRLMIAKRFLDTALLGLDFKWMRVNSIDDGFGAYLTLGTTFGD